MDRLVSLFNKNYAITLFRGDYLVIGNEHLNNVDDAYCGQLSGKTIAVSGKYAVLLFQSDFANQRKGFLIYFMPVLSSKYKIQLGT